MCIFDDLRKRHSVSPDPQKNKGLVSSMPSGRTLRVIWPEKNITLVFRRFLEGRSCASGPGIGEDLNADQMVDIPVPPVMEEIVEIVQEVVRLVPQARVQRINEQLVEVPVSSGFCRDR